MKSVRSPSAEQKGLGLKDSEYSCKNISKGSPYRQMKRNKSTKRESKTKSNRFLVTSDLTFKKFLQKKSIALPKRFSANRRVNEYLKSPVQSKTNINFENRNTNQNQNTNIYKSSNIPNIHKGNHKRITGIDFTTSSQEISKKGKMQSKITQEKILSKNFKHRKVRSQQLQTPKFFDADKFLKDEECRTIVSVFATTSRPGLQNGRPKTNQDSFLETKHLIMNNSQLFAVFDGHGTNGHFVSDFVKEILPKNIEYFSIYNNLNMKSPQPAQIQHILKQAFSKTSLDLSNSQIEINFSGSTAVVALLLDSSLYCANLGDSRAVLCSFTQENEWSVRALSRDHNAEVPTECQRILRNRGRLEPYRDEDGEELGPYRVWLETEQIPGLAMTRSFGDFVASTVGVISEPEVTHHTIEKADKFMVVASDGLWEFVSNEEAMETVIPCFMKNDCRDAVAELENLAVDYWMSQDRQVDDITITVVFFAH